ncbi:class I SAM-dependent methyltransferase [Sulfurirhabdus autotrophica]|uniref:Methyltransferase family protein n=1 Tax=Sulfurirhabdus autotrophica TaxID=1706046 RepID=A0A4R3XZV3_9PROT|nr:class I SAM-dependent methyltransferase [Sulfurirhabdus autotrophica]TCV84682.1 methyltransferase family protein [Sulfurirhabdus autotrophica]
MSLKFSYSLIAPFYDAAIAGASANIRKKNLLNLPQNGNLSILINGIGTGLDIPYLPHAHHYTGLDLTAAMLKRASARTGELRIDLVQGNSLTLPFSNESFDHAVLHLILAVVPDPLACLSETARVLKPGGSVLLLDKFLKPNQKAWFRRALTPLSAQIATRMDVVFEDVLAKVPQLKVISDEPVLAGGWFRAIHLIKT